MKRSAYGFHEFSGGLRMAFLDFIKIPISGQCTAKIA